MTHRLSRSAGPAHIGQLHSPTGQLADAGGAAGVNAEFMQQSAASQPRFAALAVPNFRRYVSGQSLSLIGTWVETVAQALLVLRLTDSGTVLGLTTAARYAPILLLSPYAGLLVDRHSRRRVLLATQAGLGLVSAVLGVSVLTGNVRLWQVVVLALLFGTLSAVDNPARQAFVQEVVGHDLVRNAVTLNSTTVNVARVIGPTIAAILISTIGIGWCFIVNAVSFMFVVASLLALDVGALHAARTARTGVRRLTWAALLYAIAVGLTAAAPTMATAVAACALVGAASVTFLTTGNATIQLASEPRYRGRVTALWSTALVGSTPIGAPVVGALSDVAGPRYALALGAAACLAAVAIGSRTGKVANGSDLSSGELAKFTAPKDGGSQVGSHQRPI